MEIKVRNFGPFASATIQPGLLNVFVGPNNSGKSMMAMLRHATVLAAPPAVFTGERPVARRLIPDLPEFGDEEAAGYFSYLERLGSGAAKPGPAPAGLRQVLDDYVEKLLNLYAQNARREIERCFGTRLLDLRRVEARQAPTRIIIRSASPRWSVEIRVARRVSGVGHQRTAVEYDVVTPKRLGEILKMTATGSIKFMRENERGWVNVDVDPPRRFLSLFFSGLAFGLFADLPSMSYYLPAARSGVMQSHRVLASSVITQAPLAGIRRMEVPRLTGVIGDFLSELVSFDQDEVGELGSVADFLERRIVHGQVGVREQRVGYPEIVYEDSAGHKFGLHRTSSMISEMAPLILYVRYLVEPGEALIIEEPESSLHPETQIRLAEAVAMLVKGGVEVTLTTHSDYFLNALNNLIQVGTLANGDGRKSNDQLPGLDADDVRAYLFQRRGAGPTKVAEVPVTARYGIAQDEFVRVAEALYERSVELDEQF